MRITRTMLEEAEACREQVRVFAGEWPDGCEITIENMKKALALRLDLDWAAENLLCEPARAAYEEARAPAFVRAYEIHDQQHEG